MICYYTLYNYRLCSTYQVNHRINCKLSNYCGCKNGKCDPKTYLARYDGTDRQEQDRQGRQGNIHAILDSPIIFSGFYLEPWVQFWSSVFRKMNTEEELASINVSGKAATFQEKAASICFI